MKFMFSLAALLAATIAASPAAAQVETWPSQVVAVHYGDLDLASAGGRSALDSRIRRAVQAACGDASLSDLRGQNHAAMCRSDLHAALIGRRDAVFAARGAGNTLLARR